MPASDPTPSRSIWMRQGRICMAARDWAGAIRTYGQGLLEQPLLGMHYAAGRAFTLAQLVQHLGHPVALLGSHFPQWGRELWQPIQTAVLKVQLPVHTFVAEHEPRPMEQAFALVLQHPADLVPLSKPRLVVGLAQRFDNGIAAAIRPQQAA